MIAGSMALVVSRRDTLRSEHSIDSLLCREAVFLVNNLVLVAMAFVVFFGTFFPLISEALGRQGVGRPAVSTTSTSCRWRSCSCCCRASGRSRPGGGRRCKTVRRNFVWPIAAGGRDVVVLLARRRHAEPAVGARCSRFAAFVIAVRRPGVRARRARPAGDGGREPAPRAVSLVRRNRRRYGGYIVHVGMALLFVGVAASSAFQHAHDVDAASPARRRTVGGYDVRYVRPTSSIAHARRRASRRSPSARCSTCRKNGKHVTTLRPSRAYYPSQDDGDLGPVGRFFEGEATSEVGMKAGLRRDLWTAMPPDISKMRADHRQGRQGLRGDRRQARRRTMQAQLLGQALAGARPALPHPAAARELPAASSRRSCRGSGSAGSSSSSAA